MLSQASVFADTASVPMLLTVETKPLDFTVTDKVNMSVYQGETALTMDPVVVTNTGTEDLKVSSIEITPGTGWSVEANTTDFATASKTALGFTCNSHDFSTGAYTPADALTAGSNLMYVINGKISAKADLMAATQVASMVFTIEKVTMISFTIAGTSYKAEEGMTWSEWVDSSYNTNDFTKTVDRKIRNNDDSYYVGYTGGSYDKAVGEFDEIVANYSYVLTFNGGGSN